MGPVLHGLSYRLSSFPASLPHFFISLPGVNSQTNYMHTNLCFRVCFWGNPNPLSKSFTISQRLMRAPLPVASSPPVFLCPAVPVSTPSPLQPRTFNPTDFASQLSLFLCLRQTPATHPSAHTSIRYVLITSICQAGISVLWLSTSVLLVWTDIPEVQVDLRHTVLPAHSAGSRMERMLGNCLIILN